MKDLLFVSNGHGEDLIAGRVIDALKQNGGRRLTLEAWSMVGRGRAYLERRIPLVGVANLLPSGGFATLSWRLMAADLRAGWLSTHRRQYRAALRLRGRYRLVVAVGDVVPISAAVLMRTPFVLIGCAKSAYYNPRFDYTFLERRLLRRYCRLVFPRDLLTVGELDRAGIRNTYLGNPMMDGLEGSEKPLGIDSGRTVVAMLPGSRADAGRNLADLLALVLPAGSFRPYSHQLTFVPALGPEFGRDKCAALMAGDSRLTAWRSLAPGSDADISMKLEGPGGLQVLAVRNRFADVLRHSEVVIGMAGTANEQAVGLGRPLIVVPSAGLQGENYVRMKMQYFGPSALAVPRNADKLCRALADLLADPQRREAMGRAGRERMGRPGAGRAIAAAVTEMLSDLRAGAGR